MTAALVEVEECQPATPGPWLDDVSLESPGSFTVLLGPSGSGKTTLLQSSAASSRRRRQGDDRRCRHTRLPPARRPTTTVFQDYALFPHMTVGANVGFGLRMRGVPQ